MSTHNICFYGELTKIILQIPSYLFFCLRMMANTSCFCLDHFSSRAMICITLGSASSAACTLQNANRVLLAIMSMAVQAYSLTAYNTWKKDSIFKLKLLCDYDLYGRFEDLNYNNNEDISGCCKDCKAGLLQ